MRIEQDVALQRNDSNHCCERDASAERCCAPPYTVVRERADIGLFLVQRHAVKAVFGPLGSSSGLSPWSLGACGVAA